jgi:L-ribulose-5-phosphate 4-epimerase
MFGDLREQVVAANRALVEAGLVALTFGNASAADRDAGVIAIKPSGVAYSALRAADVPVLDLATGETVAGAYRPSSDAPTHLALYRAFAQVNGIVHTHSPFATAWAQAGRELPCAGTTHADHFRGAVPITRALTDEEIDGPYEARTGEVIVEALDARGLGPLEMPAALVAWHGPFTWGAGVAEAVENAIALELVATMAFRTVLLGPGEPLPERLLQRHFTRKHGARAYYGQPVP